MVGVRVALSRKYCRFVHGYDGQAAVEVLVSSFPPADSAVGTLE